MTISLRLNNDETQLFKEYAKMKGITVSELIRRAVMERIEDEYDLAAYEEAMKEYRTNPVTYSHEEVCRMLEQD